MRSIGVVAVVVASMAAATSAGASDTSPIRAIGAENEYANVIEQVGGRFVTVQAILSNPNTDPHTFEANPSVARAVASAQLIVQNGVGYDTFMQELESASPSGDRKVISAQALLGLPTDTKNPHLWYKPATMPFVAKAVERDLVAIDPSHAAYFEQRLASFQRSLAPVTKAIAQFRARYQGVKVATTEPVADYLLSALGLVNKTPFPFQADIMNGVDPSPEDIAFQQRLFRQHVVKVFCYNAQVISPVTISLLALAKSTHVPVVAVYETMPTPGYDFQSWMLAEIHALTRAVTAHVSTTKL
ncbi:MAG: zinc ABC transporter substrate-binding protein [Acidimicrobiales bacterium]